MASEPRIRLSISEEIEEVEEDEASPDTLEEAQRQLAALKEWQAEVSKRFAAKTQECSQIFLTRVGVRVQQAVRGELDEIQLELDCIQQLVSSTKRSIMILSPLETRKHGHQQVEHQPRETGDDSSSSSSEDHEHSSSRSQSGRRSKSKVVPRDLPKFGATKGAIADIEEKIFYPQN